MFNLQNGSITIRLKESVLMNLSKADLVFIFTFCQSLMLEEDTVTILSEC